MKNVNTYKISDVAEIFGIHEDTLRNWEKEGLIAFKDELIFIASTTDSLVI